MPAYQEEPRDSKVSSQKQPNSSAAGDTGLAEAMPATQFRFRILVVDDESSICETARMILEDEGYEVVTAANGIEGLHSLSKSLPDLIISDLNMPRMTGFEFLAIVRQRFPHIAAIAMSGGYSSGEIPAGILADASCKKDITLSKNSPAKSGSFWLLLLFAQRGRKVTSLHCSCPETVQGT